MSSRAPKQWLLTKDETLNSFTNWKENLLYTLSLDSKFSKFLADGFTWRKKSSAQPSRGFTDDPEDQIGGQSAIQKCAQLELMLGQIANYCTVIARNTIVKNSSSLNDIWTKIREHYGFQTTGSRFLDLANVQLGAGERYEDLFQRLMSFFDDNLLTVGSLTHHGESVTADEEMSPSLENLVVFLWLQRIHDGLPALVKQRYGAELRNKTLASIKPEISQALESLLDELRSTNDARVMRSQMVNRKHEGHNNTTHRNSFDRRSSKLCCLCRASNRAGYDTHYLSQCKFLPPHDKKFLSRVRQVECYDDDFDDDNEGLNDDFINSFKQPCISNPTPIDSNSSNPYIDTPSVPVVSRRVTTTQSPHMKCFFQHYPAVVCIDTGAESNLVSEKFAKFVNLHINPTKQGAAQADGETPLTAIGETTFSLTKGAHVFHLDALVIRNLSSDIIVGEPFLEINDIGVRSAKKQIIIKGKDIIPYLSATSNSNKSATRRVTPIVCRAPPHSTTIFPGECIELPVPANYTASTVCLEPRHDSQSNTAGIWPPVQLMDVVAEHIQIKNDTSEPICVKRNDHFCQIRNVIEVPIDEITKCQGNDFSNVKNVCLKPSGDIPFSESVTVDPSKILLDQWRKEFISLNRTYDNVFEPTIGRYNDASGVIRARVNIGNSVPPSRKLKVPMYSNNNLQDLQNKFDELEKLGVFSRPEDIGVVVEHVSPSFLVRKNSGGTRLVTAFNSIGQYAKILPSVMPSVDDTLRTIAKWKYIIVTDLKDSFYQIPLDHASKKWCATATPFRGLRVYEVSAQGMPGSSETLEEMMSTIFGKMIQEGNVAKIADDLYTGGNTVEELFDNWSRVLKLISNNNLKLKAAKTIIAPDKVEILGWIWNNGNISAGSHKISPLQSCQPPPTVTTLRSFIGSYKVFNRVLRR